MTRVSILTPVCDPDVDHLRAMLASVHAQTAEVEHVLVDDASTRADVLEVLAEVAAAGSARVLTRSERGGISAATNEALAAATGEFVGFLDHDDVIEPDAVEAVLAALDAVPAADVAYSDHDFIDPDGRLVGPCLKPDWSPERLRSQNYITHFVVARRSLVDEVGGLRPEVDGAQDHDLALRLGERARCVVHVPRVLYHWRQAATSVSAGTGAKPWAFEAGRRAVADHCRRVGIDAVVEATPHQGVYRVVRTPVAPEPLVSVVVPTRGSSGRVWGVTRCFVVEAVRSLVERSTHTHLEFVVVADDETPRRVLRALRDVAGDALTIVPFDEPFNFSTKMNRGARAASGDLLLLLNDDTELIEPTSVSTMVAIATGPVEGRDGWAGGVGMVGARLLFDDGTLQHGGHVYNVGPHHACYGWPGDSPGPEPLLPLAGARECSGVTAAASLVHTELYHAVGGFPEELPLNYNDVDFSLKLRAAGHRIVYTPHASWFHFESRTRHSVVLPEETAWIERRWWHELHHDPYYHPAMVPLRFDWLEQPPLDVEPAPVDRDLPRRALAKVGRRLRGGHR